MPARACVEVGVGERVGQRMEVTALDRPALGHPTAESADVTPVRDLGRPAVVLGLEVGQVGERPQREEARLEVLDRPLDLALGRRPSRSQDDRLEPERAEQRLHLGMEPRPATLAPRDDGCVVVADGLLGHPAEAGEAAGQRRQEVGHRQAQGEHDGVGARVGQGRHQTERLAGLALADRDLDPGATSRAGRSHPAGTTSAGTPGRRGTRA